MNLIQKIDQIIEERSLLKHPFYEMWSDGKLTQESLAGYSKEYFQLVKAVPEFMTPIIEKAPNSVITELTENQQEESDHIKPWISFAGELGISNDELISYSGLDKTKKAVSDLSEFYQITNDNATEYFKLHTEADIRHTASWRNILEKSNADTSNLIEIAEKSVSAQNLLLDSCYEEYC